MQVPIEVNITSGKVDSFDALDKILKIKKKLEEAIAIELRDKIASKASNALFSTKNDYMEDLSTNGSEILLNTSRFTTAMVEEGVPSYDMKPGLLASPKAKVSKNGQRYIAVPVSKFKQGRYNWRDRSTGRYSAGSNKGGKVEFRIVSDSSPADSWIHPGHKGFHFIANTLEEFDISEFASNFLKQELAHG